MARRAWITLPFYSDFRLEILFNPFQRGEEHLKKREKQILFFAKKSLFFSCNILLFNNFVYGETRYYLKQNCVFLNLSRFSLSLYSMFYSSEIVRLFEIWDLLAVKVDGNGIIFEFIIFIPLQVCLCKIALNNYVLYHSRVFSFLRSKNEENNFHRISIVLSSTLET